MLCLVQTMVEGCQKESMNVNQFEESIVMTTYHCTKNSVYQYVWFTGSQWIAYFSSVLELEKDEKEIVESWIFRNVQTSNSFFVFGLY